MERHSVEVATIGYASALLLPGVGPLVVLLATRERGRFVRSHLTVALALSALWLLVALIILSLDAGYLTIEEQGASLGAICGLALSYVAVATIISVNIGRARRALMPICMPDRLQTPGPPGREE